MKKLSAAHLEISVEYCMLSLCIKRDEIERFTVILSFNESLAAPLQINIDFHSFCIFFFEPFQFKKDWMNEKIIQKSIHSYVFSIYINTKEIAPLGWKWKTTRDSHFMMILNRKIIKIFFFIIKSVSEKSLFNFYKICQTINHFLRSSLWIQTG